jgi:hypothetical protein
MPSACDAHEICDITTKQAHALRVIDCFERCFVSDGARPLKSPEKIVLCMHESSYACMNPAIHV